MDNVFTLKTNISFCSNGMVNLSHNTLQTITSKKEDTKGTRIEGARKSIQLFNYSTFQQTITIVDVSELCLCLCCGSAS